MKKFIIVLFILLMAVPAWAGGIKYRVPIVPLDQTLNPEMMPACTFPSEVTVTELNVTYGVEAVTASFSDRITATALNATIGDLVPSPGTFDHLTATAATVDYLTVTNLTVTPDATRFDLDFILEGSVATDEFGIVLTGESEADGQFAYINPNDNASVELNYVSTHLTSSLDIDICADGCIYEKLSEAVAKLSHIASWEPGVTVALNLTDNSYTESATIDLTGWRIGEITTISGIAFSWDTYFGAPIADPSSGSTNEIYLTNESAEDEVNAGDFIVYSGDGSPVNATCGTVLSGVWDGSKTVVTVDHTIEDPEPGGTEIIYAGVLQANDHTVINCTGGGLFLGYGAVLASIHDIIFQGDGGQADYAIELWNGSRISDYGDLAINDFGVGFLVQANSIMVGGLHEDIGTIITDCSNTLWGSSIYLSGNSMFTTASNGFNALLRISGGDSDGVVVLDNSYFKTYYPRISRFETNGKSCIVADSRSTVILDSPTFTDSYRALEATNNSFISATNATVGTMIESNTPLDDTMAADFSSTVVAGYTAPTYTLSNVSEDREYDANSTSDAEVADILGTLIQDLIDRGYLAAP